MRRANPFFKADSNDYVLTIKKCLHFELECYISKSGKAPLLAVWDSNLENYNSIGLIYYMDYAADIKEDIIETIEEVVNRNWGNEIIGNNFTLISVIVEPVRTYITSGKDLVKGKGKSLLDSSLLLSTEDFKAISLEWLKVLESLEGQKRQICLVKVGFSIMTKSYNYLNAERITFIISKKRLVDFTEKNPDEIARAPYY